MDISNFTAEEGSTIVTLKPKYLETLSSEKLTFAIVFNTGTASTEFTITAEQIGSGDDQTEGNQTGGNQTGGIDQTGGSDQAGSDTKQQEPNKNEDTATSSQTGDNSIAVLWIACCSCREPDCWKQ